ncbi:MAG: hypothetical protein R2874_15435 [Desulfobacterales bacterium]
MQRIGHFHADISGADDGGPVNSKFFQIFLNRKAIVHKAQKKTPPADPRRESVVGRTQHRCQGSAYHRATIISSFDGFTAIT